MAVFAAMSPSPWFVWGCAVEPSTVNRELISAYGAVKAEDESKIQRSTVLIDKEGKIAAVWFPVWWCRSSIRRIDRDRARMFCRDHGATTPPPPSKMMR